MYLLGIYPSVVVHYRVRMPPQQSWISRWFGVLGSPIEGKVLIGPNWFASVMGTAIVASAGATLPVAVPQFITTADNDGSPFPYSKDAMCRYDAGGGEIVYVSLVDSNSALPTDTTKWLPLPAFILNQIEVESDANRQSLDGVVEAWDVYAGNSSGSTQTVSFSSLATMGSTDYDIQVTRLARGGGALSLSDVPTVSNITTTSFDLTFASSVNSSWTYSWRVKGLGVLA